MDVVHPPKDKVNYATIDERKSEESDDSKNINLSNISEPQSQLSDQSSPEYSPLRQEKSLESEKECSSSDEVSPRLLHKEIRQKLLEFYRAELSELDVIHKNITGLNKMTVFAISKNLSKQRLLSERVAAEEDANLQICINKWFLTSLNLIIFWLLKK